MDNKVVKVIKYFSFFGYYPTLNEIYMFLEAKISRNSLEKRISDMVSGKILLASKYTPPQYSIKKKISNNKYQISKRKLKNWRFKIYVKLISLFPQIRLVGLSGSISMMNADEDDDIDLFIITARNRLFTGRLIALVLAQLFGLRRSRERRKNNNKICLNLFFDEMNMKVPKFKQTKFVGHEVLQMKPIINKEMTYERFLASNKWVYKIFPNAKKTSDIQFSIFSEKSGGWLESKLKKTQLWLINKHKTTEIITSTQLWFHPDDFEKKIKI